MSNSFIEDHEITMKDIALKGSSANIFSYKFNCHEVEWVIQIFFQSCKFGKISYMGTFFVECSSANFLGPRFEASVY